MVIKISWDAAIIRQIEIIVDLAYKKCYENININFDKIEQIFISPNSM